MKRKKKWRIESLTKYIKEEWMDEKDRRRLSNSWLEQVDEFLKKREVRQ